jgi:hypothetical protein
MRGRFSYPSTQLRVPPLRTWEWRYRSTNTERCIRWNLCN